LGEQTSSLAAEIAAVEETYAAINRNDIPAAVLTFDPQMEGAEARMQKAVIVLAAWVFAATLSGAAAGQVKYSLREGWDGSAAGIPHRLASSSLPFDKSYDELSLEQKAIIRAEYTQLGENDEPPYPEGGKGPLVKVIAKMQHIMLVTGELSLIARIDEHGDAQTVSVLKTPSDSVSQAVAYAVMQTKFKPGICDSKVCAMDFPLRVSFTVRTE